MSDPWEAQPRAASSSRLLRFGQRSLLILGAWLIGAAGPVAAAYGLGPVQEHGAVAMAVVALALAAGLALVPRWWMRPVVVAAAVAVGEATTHATVATVPVLIALAGVTVASAALSGWGLLPGQGRLATAAERPALLVLPVVAAAGALWRHAPRVSTYLVVLALSGLLLVVYKLVPARLEPFDRGVVRLVRRLATVVAGAVMFVVSVPILWLPGALGLPVTASAARARSRRTSWSARSVEVFDHRRDASFPFASAEARSRRRQAIFGVVLGAALVTGLVVAIRSGPRRVVIEAVAPAGSAHPPPGGSTTNTQPEVDPANAVNYRDLLAGRGLPWADEVQSEQLALPLPPGPVAGYDLGPYRTRYTNVADGERRTLQPDPCHCRPVDIWFVGGSVAFGSGQRDLYTIPSDLVRMGNQQGQSLQIHNIAVPGYTLWQEYQKVEAKLASGAHKPDLIVFYDGLNDVVQTFVQIVVSGPDWSAPVVYDPIALKALTNATQATVAAALRKYGGTQIIGQETATRLAALRTTVRSGLSADGMSSEFFFQPDATVTPAQRRAGFAADHRLTPLVVTLFNQVITTTAARVRSSGHDLRGVFDHTTQPLFFDLGHTNEDGAAIVARAMYGELYARLESLSRS